MSISRLKYLFLMAILIMVQSGCSKNLQNPQIMANDSNNGKIAGDYTGCYIGAFVNGVGNISEYSNLIGRNPAAILIYVDFTQDFPLSDANQITKSGAIPCITWEPWKAVTSENLFPLKAIAGGSFDAYLLSWAQSAKNYKYQIFLRFAHEMNGNWYPWSGYQSGAESGDAVYISAWRHVYNIFKSAGATNVTWVWNVNAESVPSQSWNTPDKYFPGDSYVDWISIDGYNFGTSQSFSSWKSFDDIFLAVYNSLKSLYPGKPLMIGEMACSETGGSKPDWITDAFSKIKTNYKYIKLFNWFNINKETDWRVNSGLMSLASFKAAMADKIYFLGK